LVSRKLKPTAAARPRNLKAGAANNKPHDIMSIGTIFLIVLLLLMVGAIPSWPHSRNWGYIPSGSLGLIFVVLLVLLLLRKI
jgi:hypothetical protein